MPVCLDGDRHAALRYADGEPGEPALRVSLEWREMTEQTSSPTQSQATSAIRVAIIEDQRDIREGLATMLKFTDGYSCIAPIARWRRRLMGSRETRPK